MCDIGRFDYHWIEGDNRVVKPLAGGQPVSWRDALAKIVERLAAAGTASPAAVRFLVSAHASHEELFLFRRLTEELIGPAGPGSIAVSWRVHEKPQPEHAKFTVPPVDAPNVAGARAFGLAPGAPDAAVGAADLSALEQAVQSGRVAALVFDPGPAGSIGDCRWIVDARKSGKLPLLIVQGVLMTELARAADFVLPGASYVEKEASYTNDQGRLQAAARAVPRSPATRWKTGRFSSTSPSRSA